MVVVCPRVRHCFAEWNRSSDHLTLSEAIAHDRGYEFSNSVRVAELRASRLGTCRSIDRTPRKRANETPGDGHANYDTPTDARRLGEDPRCVLERLNAAVERAAPNHGERDVGCRS